MFKECFGVFVLFYLFKMFLFGGGGDAGETNMFEASG